jgi:hypothetical protein
LTINTSNSTSDPFIDQTSTINTSINVDTMLATGLAIAAIAATAVSAAPTTKHSPNYVDWSTFNATGVNLGG